MGSCYYEKSVKPESCRTLLKCHTHFTTEEMTGNYRKMFIRDRVKLHWARKHNTCHIPVPPALQAECFKKWVMYILQTGCTYRFIHRGFTNQSKENGQGDQAERGDRKYRTSLEWKENEAWYYCLTRYWCCGDNSHVHRMVLVRHFKTKEA